MPLLQAALLAQQNKYTVTTDLEQRAKAA